MNGIIDGNGNGPAPSEQDERPIVKGDRICLHCKGICHEDSVRSTVPKSLRFRGGMRSHYFCDIQCLKNYFYYKFKIDDIERLSGEEKAEAFLEEMVQDWLGGNRPRYEMVDVITL